MHSIRTSMLALVFCLVVTRAGGQPLLIGAKQPPNPSAASKAPRRADDSQGANTSTALQGRPTVESTGEAVTANAPDAAQDRFSGQRRAPALEEVRPEVMYLRDKNGRLVPTPGFSYEDFLEMLQLKARVNERPVKVPGHNLQQLLITGSAGAQLAELTARVDVQLRQPVWTPIPLGLNGVALAGPPKYEGPGDYFVNYDEDRQQYIAWLRGPPGSEHRLTISMRAPLVVTGAQTTLPLSLPRAASSKLELKVPGRDVNASATPAGFVPEVARNDELSTISLFGIAGSFTLAWSDRSTAAASKAPVLESGGLVLVRIDGRSITSDATLSVRSFSAPFERFRVRLPEGAVLTSSEQTGYTASSVGPPGSSLVEVKLDTPTTGPVEVHLQSERTFDLARPETLELAGFQVLEAVAHRQGGQIGVAVTGDWQVLWENRARVRQIDAAEEADQLLRQSDLLAAFEYVGQPCSLTARIVPRQPRISVDPEYVYYVDAYQTVLKARLKYSIRGAKVFSLELDVPGWQLDEIGPASVVDMSSVTAGEDARTRIPFVQPMMGEIEIILRAHRSHAANSGDIELRLPVIKDAVVGPATVAIIPEDNVELTTRTESLESLSPQQAPATLELPVRRQEPLIFRGERANAKYVAGLTVHDQKIEVQVGTEATVGGSGVAVEQRLGYRVLYEPIERLSFSVPASLVSDSRLQLYVNQQPVKPELIGGGQNGERELRMQITLDEPRIGLVEVVGRYKLELGEPSSAKLVPVVIPLVMPLDGEFARNTLTVNCDSGYAAELRGGHWKPADRDESAGRSLLLESATAASSAALSILVADRPAARAAVERAWMQTWLASQIRQERAVFQISARQPRISLALPDGASTSELEALVDSRPVRPTLKNGNMVIVDWPADDDAHTLELRYTYEVADDGWRVALDAPDFGDGVRLRRMFWQLIVPRDQHLITASASLIPEFQWVFDRMHWSRSNRLEQRELEDWTRTLHEAVTPESMNVYLFSAIGNEAAFDVWIARRSTIVFLASSIILAVVLVALYAPALRRAQSLIAIGAVVITMALAYPEAAMVLSQAALIGLLLAIMAVLLRRLLPGEPSGNELARPQTKGSADKSSTDVFYKAAAAGNSSTATRALTLEQASSRSHVQ